MHQASLQAADTPVVFASDLHLTADIPARSDDFDRLADECARRGAALYLLGDVFDLWLGDDDDRAPHPRALATLRALARAGRAAHVQRGNHDLLLGERFAADAGATLMADEHVLTHHGRRLLLMHGDLLCTDDVEYLAFRAYAHSPEQQARFLAQPLSRRLEEAGAFKQRSRIHTGGAAAEIMDVTDAAVLDAAARHEATVLIHGHTHRPDDHLHAGGVERRVLSDWHRPPEVMVHDHAGFERVALPDLPGRLGSA